MSVLVTGGAGYIGSNMALALLDSGERPVIIDDLSTGSERFVPDGAVFVRGDIGDRDLLESVFAEHAIREVIHFAGSIVVPDSVAHPLDYYFNNTVKSRSLVETCVSCGVRKFIFSSTAAVYGNPERLPIDESSPLRPISPYGRSKLMTEWMLEDVARAHDFDYAALRYFNVAGADPQGRAGQAQPRATHLIKIAAQVVVGLRQDMSIFGDDYKTPDGTCIRDYIHVTDLADAHMAALRRLREQDGSFVVNCGYGRGFSVKEVLSAVERVTGVPVQAEVAPRRKGDPPQLVADSATIRTELGWTPSYDDLDLIVRTAIDWERRISAEGG
ncbi:MAG: UDP-glucose 4-epimerase GalE [Pseudomonadota bacterium]